jgi:hypothetical protein
MRRREHALGARITFGQVAQRDRDRLIAPGGDDGLARGQVSDQGSQRGGSLTSLQQREVVERHRGPLGERGDLRPGVFAERPERPTVRPADHDPTQRAQSVLIKADIHVVAPGSPQRS